MTDRGRILFVASSYPRFKGDSTATFVHNLAADLIALGWSVDALVPHAPGLTLHEEMDGVQVYRFRYFQPESAQTVCYGSGALVNLRTNPINYLKLPALVVAQWAAVSSRLKKSRYDLVHSHWILPQALTAGVAAHRANVGHVATAHGSDVLALKGGASRLIKKFTLRFADAITVNSSATEGSVRRLVLDGSHVHLIPMGATSPRDLSPEERDKAAALKARLRRGDGPLLAFVGRLIAEKGVADLLHALQLIVETLPEATAVIVGDGQDRSQFEALAEKLGISSRVTFVGKVPNNDVPIYLQLSDAFVAPSVTSAQGGVEAQGVSIAEAMLAGVPVIATRSGGIVDSVRDAETGLLVDEHAPEQIAAAAIKLHRSPELRARLIEVAGKWAKGQLTRGASANAFSELYQRVIADR